MHTWHLLSITRNFQLLRFRDISRWRLAAILVTLKLLALIAWFSFHLFPGSSVRGLALGSMTERQAERALADSYLDRTLTLHIGTTQLELPLRELGVSVDTGATYRALRSAQLSSLADRRRRQLSDPLLTIDESRLHTKLAAVLPAYSSPATNAELSIKTGTVSVSEAKFGTEYPADKAALAVRQTVLQSITQIVVPAQEIKPNVSTENLQGSRAMIEAMLAANISFGVAGETYRVSPSQISQMLAYDAKRQTVSLDPIAVAAYMKKLASQTDVLPTDEVKTVMDGRELSDVPGTDGRSLDQPSAVRSLSKAISDAHSVSFDLQFQTLQHQLSYIKKVSPYGSRYIEVSISNQHLWIHQDGAVSFETAVTTGAANAGDATPPGVYHIYSKHTDLHLYGPTWDDYVSYWMPFYGEYGLHDATWRNNFGTKDYANVGSHGCVNLPLAAAGWIFVWANVGTTVLIEA